MVRRGGGAKGQVGPQIEQLVNRDVRAERGERARQVDLFSIFSGALAVQESLQLDAMRGNLPRSPAPRPAGPSPELRTKSMPQDNPGRHVTAPRPHPPAPP